MVSGQLADKIGTRILAKDDNKKKPTGWVFADDIDASYQELQSSGANIVEPLKKKPWGLRHFTVKDLDGNIFYFHHD